MLHIVLHVFANDIFNINYVRQEYIHPTPTLTPTPDAQTLINNRDRFTFVLLLVLQNEDNPIIKRVAGSKLVTTLSVKINQTVFQLLCTLLFTQYSVCSIVRICISITKPFNKSLSISHV